MRSSKRILIVDDDSDDIEIFCDAVNEVDKSVDCNYAIDGVQALQLLTGKKSSKPDYIFLDLNMPRMNGKQFLTYIKEHNGLRHIPVIIYTTSKMPEDIEETKKLGAIHFVTKPSKLSELKNIISCVLEEKWEKLAY